MQTEEPQAVQATTPTEAEKPSDGDSAPQEATSETVTETVQEQPTRRTRRRAEPTTPDSVTEAKGAPAEAQNDNTPPWEGKTADRRNCAPGNGKQHRNNAGQKGQKIQVGAVKTKFKKPKNQNKKGW